MHLRKRLSVALIVGALLAPISACTGDAEDAGPELAPAEALAQAKRTLDETSGVALTLSTDDLPDGVTGVEKAEGVGTHAPAFEGTITVVLLGQAVEVPVVAVDGRVYAKLPFTTGYQDVDPAEYGAPDPARLLSPDAGFSSLLEATEDPERGERVRGGAGNKEVLTEYTGTLTDDVVKHIIPSASGEFDATYLITGDGELRSADLTGVFYADSGPMTYTVTFEDYGTEPDITAP